MRSLSLLAAVVFGVVNATNNDTCRFALKYTKEDLVSNADIRHQFLDQVYTWEAKFVKELGVDPKSGLTFDGQQLDVETGLPIGKPHLFTASSKESIHLTILSKALNNDIKALHFYS